jgi:hypothetical protein
MALELSLSSPIQSADLTTLTLQDNTGTGTTGWSNGSNTKISDIDGSNPATDTVLTISITISTPENPTGTTYDDIDVYTYFSGSMPVAYTGLIFNITSNLLLYNGSALGEAIDELPDGWYDIEYYTNHNLTADVGTADTYSVSILVEGGVSYDVYESLRFIPNNQYNQLDIYKTPSEWGETWRALYKYTLLKSLVSSPTTSNKEEMLNILDVLNRLCTNTI